MTTLRCSSLNIVTACAPAALPPKVHIELGEPEIPALGSAVHEIQAAAINGTPCDMGAVSDRWQIELWELQKLAGMAAGVWKKASRFFPEPVAEVAMDYSDSELTLTGTADVVSLLEDEARIADHKTGFLDVDAEPQIKGYAFLAAKKFKRKTVRASVLRVREQSLQTFLYGIDELEAWWAWLKEHVKRQVYRPDYDTCGRCKRWHECDAGASLTRQAAEYLIDWGPKVAGADVFAMTEDTRKKLADELVIDLSPEMGAEVIHRARLVEKAAAFARGLIKTYVKHAGEPDPCDPTKTVLTMEDGAQLEINRIRKREIAYSVDSVELIRQAIGTEAFPGVCKISPTVLDTAVKAAAPRGMKSTAVQGLKDRLEQAGCLTFETVERLDVKSAPKAKIGVKA